MQGFGARLRQRAAALGLSDTAVADRLGLSQQRYYNYVSDQNEPDLAMLVRICRVLDTSPGWLLAMGPEDTPDAGDVLRSRIAGAATAMEVPTLELVAVMVEAVARRDAAASAPNRGRRKT